MDGVTDTAFRSITARHGRPDVSFTEFTAVDRIVRGYDPDLTDLRYSEIERPVVAQVFGTDPDAFYHMAHIVGELGFDGIDINMGCPSKTISGRGAGAGLIRTPERACMILRRTREGIMDWASGQRLDQIGLPPVVVASVCRENHRRYGACNANTGIPPRRKIPVSVKTRLGYEHIIIEDWMRHLLSEFPSVISVHGRTLTQHYRGEANWEAIAKAAQIARGSNTLLLGNGDIRSAAIAVHRIRETGVHGVLLGRVTLGNPWIFTTSSAIRMAVRFGGPLPDDPVVPTEEKLKVALEHAEIFQYMKGHKSYRCVRKYLAAYCRGFPNASELRQRLVRSDIFLDVESILRPVVCG